MKISISLPILILYFVTPSTCRINSKLYDKNLNIDQNNLVVHKENSIGYIKTSIPIHMFQCMHKFKILKCMKIFILQRMERTAFFANSGNLTTDFLNQILSSSGNDEIFNKYYTQMNETEIDERLLLSFQKFFKNREIKLHFIPGMVVKVVSNTENTIKFSIKRAYSDQNLARRTKPHEYLIQFGIPAVMMPAILMGAVLPFVLPALKMATLMSGLVSHSALVAAVLYAVKTATMSGDKTGGFYINPGYH